MKIILEDDVSLEPETNEVDGNAMGGTELMKYGLYDRVDPELLKHFQIVCSRFRGREEGKKCVYWLHDLPNDPESSHLADGGWQKFDKIVYVSHWQKQQYQNYLGIPPSKGAVLKNAIVPLPDTHKNADTVRLIYHTTPHRGLEILYPVFNQLCTVFDNIELDVFSSFEAYGWPERDEPYQELFDSLREHPKINYHGYQPNEVVREALEKAHIFAYPSIWPETSCIALMEAMSAGCLCVHPDLAALPETGGNFTYMYPFHEDLQQHANQFGNCLHAAISLIQDEEKRELLASRQSMQKTYADSFYSWDIRQQEWTGLLAGLLENAEKAAN